MPPLLFLDEIDGALSVRVGTKAATLARLKRLGLPVPDGFVVGEGDPLDDDGLGKALLRLGGPVAVRSSAAGEDGAEASFAGQYETILGASGLRGVRQAIERCRASAEAGRAYASVMGAPAGAMAVLVQRLVEPRTAGVAFTRHPHDPESILVESVAGRGDALLAGAAIADRYVVERATRKVTQAEGRGSLDTEALQGVVGLALRVEELEGTGQDVEWAIGPLGLVLLQARPITVEPEPRLDPRAFRLTRANVGEVLPDPVTPLTWTTIGASLEYAFRRVARSAGLLPEGAAPVVVLYRQRIYLNLSLGLEIAGRLPGLSAEDAQRLILGGEAGAAGPTGVPITALPGLLSVALRLFRLDRARPHAVAEAEALVAALPAQATVKRASRSELVRLLEEWLDVSRRVATTHILASGASASRLALLGRLLGRGAQRDGAAAVNRLMSGLDGVLSAAPAIALEAMAARIGGRALWSAWLEQADPGDATEAILQAPPDLRDELLAFLERYGHRAVSEGELASPAWEDDPGPVIGALKTLRHAPATAALSRLTRAEARDAEAQAFLARASLLLRGALARTITGAQDGVRERERTKSLTVAVARHGRRLVRAAAHILASEGSLPDQSDVFFLEWTELLSTLAGLPLPAPSLLARRRRRRVREAALEAPREVDLRPRPDTPAPERPDDATVLRGIGVSPGRGRGRVSIVLGGRGTLEPGDVLVTPVLDAALGPLLASAAGAITEMGGMLSHGSVVARELGVPCVVDVRGATRLLSDGDVVVVDGDRGEVTRVADEDAVSASGTRTGESSEIVDEGPGERSRLLSDRRARESVYFSVQDESSGLRLIATLGARAHGRGEALFAVALPDGRTLFGLDRGPAGGGPLALRVGDAEASFQPPRLQARLRLSAHEHEGFPPSPIPLLLSPRTIEVAIDLSFHPTTPAVDFCRSLPEAARSAIAPLGHHHVEQAGRWTGSVAIDGRRVPVSGVGSRDHSWGLRDWDALDYSRLFVAHLGDDLAVHALILSVRGTPVEGGFVWRAGRAHKITRVLHATDDTRGRLEVELEVHTPEAPPLRLRARVLRTITVPVSLERRPWRHLAGRPYALTLHEGFARWEAEGRAGWGMVERSERPL